jgi:translation initiation factor 1
MTAPGRIATGGGGELGHNPFGGLDMKGLRPGPASAAPQSPPKRAAPAAHRGRVDITREKGGRGGKTVTVVGGFTGIGLPEKERLAKQMRAACGCGGTVKEGEIVIQGDQRDAVARILEDAGFRPVFAGG